VMATIFSSSDTAPLNSVIIFCTAVTTLTYCREVGCLQSEPELTDLLFVGVQRSGYSVLLRQEGGGLPQELGAPVVVLHCTASEHRHEGDTWHGEVGGEHPPRRSFGCSLALPLLQLLLRLSAAPIIGGMGLLSLHQLAVTPSWSGGSVFSFRALFVQVATPAPQTTGRLLTVGPNVAELLAVVALH
jgi:hypothetical protein